MASMLKGDPQLQREFSRLIDRVRPGGLKRIEYRQNALNRKQQFETMQKQVEELRNAETQRQNAIAQQQQEQQIRQQTSQLYSYIDNRVKQLQQYGINISEADLRTIAESAVPMIQANGFNPQAVANHFENYFRMIENQSKQSINNYQIAKRNAPPAPPSGGASPTIRPTPIQNDDDFEAMAASFLAKQLGM